MARKCLSFAQQYAASKIRSVPESSAALSLSSCFRFFDLSLCLPMTLQISAPYAFTLLTSDVYSQKL